MGTQKKIKVIIHGMDKEVDENPLQGSDYNFFLDNKPLTDVAAYSPTLNRIVLFEVDYRTGEKIPDDTGYLGFAIRNEVVRHGKITWEAKDKKSSCGFAISFPCRSAGTVGILNRIFKRPNGTLLTETFLLGSAVAYEVDLSEQPDGKIRVALLDSRDSSLLIEIATNFVIAGCHTNSDDSEIVFLTRDPEPDEVGDILRCCSIQVFPRW